MSVPQVYIEGDVEAAPLAAKMSYDDFIAAKIGGGSDHGFEASSMSERLYPFQREIVAWTAKKGRAYTRGYAAGREAHAEDWAASENLSDLALRTLGRVRACNEADKDSFQQGFLNGLAAATAHWEARDA